MRLFSVLFSFILFSFLFHVGCSNSNSEPKPHIVHARVLETGINVLIEKTDLLDYYSSGDTVMLWKEDANKYWQIYGGSYISGGTSTRGRWTIAVLLPEKKDEDKALIKISGAPAMVMIQDDGLINYSVDDTVVVRKNENSVQMSLSNRVVKRDDIIKDGVSLNGERYWLGVIVKKF